MGVYGESNTSYGVAGVSLNSLGVIGDGYGPNGVGIRGYSDTGLAGFFLGRVHVAGSLTVTGAKSAAGPHPDASHRRLYSLECPDSWLEDFGRAEIVRGQAWVELDSD